MEWVIAVVAVIFATSAAVAVWAFAVSRAQDIDRPVTLIYDPTDDGHAWRADTALGRVWVEDVNTDRLGRCYMVTTYFRGEDPEVHYVAPSVEIANRFIERLIEDRRIAAA